jgi:hypothetical protein
MAVVFEAMPFRPARRQRQHWVEPIQSLDRCLFVNAKHGRMLRWIQVQANDVRRFGFEIRILTGHISLHRTTRASANADARRYGT